jgi:hypothetical protein
MIIDTEILRNKIANYMYNQGKKIDETIKDDSRAMAMFTRLETEEIKIYEAITFVESLQKEYC